MEKQNKEHYLIDDVIILRYCANRILYEMVLFKGKITSAYHVAIFSKFALKFRNFLK